jgi:hypothetical protein
LNNKNDRVPVRYQIGTEGIDTTWLGGFFVGWRDPPDPARHLRILNGSSVAIVAVDDGAQQVIGFITAITDGSFAAYIPLLEVFARIPGVGNRHGTGPQDDKGTPGLLDDRRGL